MDAQECLEFVHKELWRGVHGIAFGNVGKKRIVIELAKDEEPKASSSAISKEAVEAGEGFTGGVVRSVDHRVHVDAVIPPSLNESFERLTRSVRQWSERGN